MRFLVDECLPQRFAVLLHERGYDALHVADLGLLGAPDRAVMAAAAADGRTVLSADTDFGELLATARGAAPSVVLFRDHAPARRRVRTLLGHLDQIADDLLAGAVVVVGRERLRIRRLPLAEARRLSGGR